MERTSVEIYRDELSRIVDDLFRNMLQTEVVPCYRACTLVPEQMTARVTFDGGWSGELVLRSNTRQARQFASLFCGESDGDLEEESRDAMGELANIIAGNLGQVLPRGSRHGLPTVVRGFQKIPVLPLLAHRSFELHDNVFSLELSEHRSTNNNIGGQL